MYTKLGPAAVGSCSAELANAPRGAADSLLLPERALAYAQPKPREQLSVMANVKK